jgi:hypothetical protein
MPILARSVPKRTAAIKINEENPLVWDSFDQDRELEHLRLWLPKVESRPHKELLCRAIGELIQQDLVRYGICRDAKGFGVIGDWVALEEWATNIFRPSDPVGWALVCGLCNPRIMLMNTGYNHGKSELVFVSLLAGGGGTMPTLRRRKR